jgi:hypothetical protein
VNEKLAKDALATIERLNAQVAQLTERCAALEADLSKARGGKPTLKSSVRDAVRKAITPAESPGHAAAGRQPDVTAVHAALEDDPPPALVARRRREAEAEAEFEARRAQVRRNLRGEE